MKNLSLFGVALILLLAVKSYGQEDNDKYELRINPGVKYNVQLSGFECGLSLEHPQKMLGVSLRRDFLFGFGRVSQNGDKKFELFDFCSQTYFDILLNQHFFENSRSTFGVGFGLFTDALLAGMNGGDFGSGTPPYPFQNTYTKVISLSLKQTISWLTIEVRGDILLLPKLYVMTTSNSMVHPISISLLYSFSPKKSK